VFRYPFHPLDREKSHNILFWYYKYKKVIKSNIFIDKNECLKYHSGKEGEAKIGNDQLGYPEPYSASLRAMGHRGNIPGGMV
jgi:hypothetical protein